MKKIIIFFIIAIFSIQSVDVSVGEEVFGDATNKTNEYKGCEHVIIGGGWGGSYFAWRSSVDTDSKRKTLMDPKTVCLFEATNRIGGRAYSKEGIPGMQDLIIDLGAYRFDSHTHVLVNHVITKVLGHSTKCYDDGKCNKYGNLTVIKDSYGNALGYKKGPVGLIDLFKQKGGRVFLEHQLNKICRGSDNKRILLTFKNGASLTCSSAFLNLPKPSLDYLDSNSILFTSSSEETKFALSVPKQDPGSKQYLIYKNAPWRKFKKLREGTFINNTIKNPPLNGRLHEFYGKCSPDYDNMDCWGAILTYYDFIMEDVKYFSKFQKSTSDPYTYIKFDENSNSEESEMIRKAHNQFCQALDSFNVPGFNSSSLPYPEGTVISVWWARDEASSILPPPSYMGQHDLKYMVDPNHAIRNRISKPLDEFNIYIANEAFSGGNGWAEPSLIMTERILWKHFKSKPTWIEDVNDCFYGDSKNCSDVPSEIWWKNKIDHLIDTTKFITNCEKTKDSLVTVENDKCVVIREKGRQLRSVPNDKCTTRFKYEHLDLSWEWISTTDIKIIYQIVAKGWAGLGIGSSMSKADMVIARRLGNKQCVVEQYWSEGHVAPKITEEKYIYNVSCKISNNDRLVVSFSRPMSVDSTKNNQSMPIFNDKPTDIIYAFNDDTNSDKELKQHNTYGNLKADFSCGKLLVPLFDRDIVQLFREKDREAMLFAFDLHDYNQTKAVAKELLDVLKANAIYSLEDGMPKDKSWSVLELHTLIAWIDTNYSTSNISCGEKSPTFSNDIKVLFRAKDRNSMLFMFDLWDYNDVKTNGPAIYKSLLGQTMPCDSEGRWTKEKLDTFNTWMLCGYEEGNDQSSLTDREVFYYGMNIEDFESKRPLLKKNLKQYLSLARQQGTPEANPLNSTKYRIFQNYTNEYFSSFCDNLYADLAKQAEEYDPVNDPDFNTKNKVLNRITQMAPFNLVDGTWISNCCPTGPIDEVHSMLWGILNDEMGMGEVSKNHCQLYQELLNSVGVYTSPIHTLDFANDVRFLDSAFTQPAYAILLSLFSREHFEELLGTTLQIEWCVLGIVPSLNLLKFWGINPHFYELHVGIDNAAKGHGYRARRAIEIYLDNVRENKGEKGVQESWRRIWDGFLAFDALGTLGDDLNEMNMKLSSPEKQVLELIEQKAKYGHFNHRSKRLGDPLINDLFSDSQLFLESLRDSAWIVKGNPDASPLMNHLLSFAGPMFKVFDDNDINVWRNWIWSLKTNKHQKGKVDSYDAMRNLVKRVMMTAMSEEAHHRIRIWGPSPNNNSELIEQSVTNWLEASRNDPDIMLSVLSHPQNRLIIKEKPYESHFVTSVIKPGSEMGAVYARAASDAPDLVDDKHKSSLWSWTDIVVRWIEDGCPMKQLPGHTYSLFPQPKVKKSKSRRKRRHKKSGRHHVH